MFTVKFENQYNQHNSTIEKPAILKKATRAIQSFDECPTTTTTGYYQ